MRSFVPARESGLDGARVQRRRSSGYHWPTVCCAIDDDEGRAIDPWRPDDLASTRTVKTCRCRSGRARLLVKRPAAGGPPPRRTGGVRPRSPIAMVEAYCAAGPSQVPRRNRGGTPNAVGTCELVLDSTIDDKLSASGVSGVYRSKPRTAHRRCGRRRRAQAPVPAPWVGVNRVGVRTARGRLPR